MTTIEELQSRVEVLEQQMAKMARLVEVGGGPAVGNTFDQWLARRQQQTPTQGDTQEVRRALGIPPELPHIGAIAVQELMLAEGVDPEDRILSGEIIRVRDEARP
ncbi:MAG TPA: hypothetical protein VFJ58_06645 [Armatimonadota bacterium]|nr:hypothetical protein [Armatimonadota bacterium]